jgi:branched-chain amino acid transport system ATP-binding protein
MLSPAKTTDALTAAGVCKRFGGLVAVDDISFKLAEREVLGLIGPNGSGKTTMMNLVSGALKPTSGAISVYGEAVTGTGASNVARKGIARTFQLVRMLPTMTALENVAAGGVFGHARRWGKELDDYARGLLDRVGLPNAARTPVSALTYIDQKRVELARALASEPKILLLDECCTIIIVEHVMHAIRSLCDRCIVMNSGAKIAEGTPAEVLADHGVIRAYLGDENA